VIQTGMDAYFVENLFHGIFKGSQTAIPGSRR